MSVVVSVWLVVMGRLGWLVADDGRSLGGRKVVSGVVGDGRCALERHVERLFLGDDGECFGLQRAVRVWRGGGAGEVIPEMIEETDFGLL